jgi:hypothetical protein
MTLLLSIAVPLAVIYCLFLAWYGGRGKPLSPAEIEHFLAELNAHARSERDSAAVAEVRLLLANDDGKEFVMQNLVRHRPRAAYPPGYPPGYASACAYDDDARKADTRWGKAILWPLLRFGNHPVFVAQRCGKFVEPEGADAWHYVAMVRYRSRRDFLRFALVVQKAGLTVHKWAAIEKTHVFPVKPLVSLIFVRGLMATALVFVGALIYLLAR